MALFGRDQGYRPDRFSFEYSTREVYAGFIRAMTTTDQILAAPQTIASACSTTSMTIRPPASTAVG